MQIRTRVRQGETVVEVVDPSDGTVVRSEVVSNGQQFVVSDVAADSPADLEFGEVEPIPDPEAEEGEGGAQTTEAVEKPLYRVISGPAPDGFVASGLETPDGSTLFTFDGDVEGEAHTYEVDDETVTLYAESDDGEQPVVPAPTDPEPEPEAVEPEAEPEVETPEPEAEVEQPGGSAEGAEDPADGGGTPAEVDEDPSA